MITGKVTERPRLFGVTRPPVQSLKQLEIQEVPPAGAWEIQDPPGENSANC